MAGRQSVNFNQQQNLDLGNFFLIIKNMIKNDYKDDPFQINRSPTYYRAHQFCQMLDHIHVKLDSLCNKTTGHNMIKYGNKDMD